MVARLGYKNKLVEVRNGVVYLFDGKLWSAPPLERVVEYYLEGQGGYPGANSGNRQRPLSRSSWRKPR